MGILDTILDALLSDGNKVDPFSAAGIAYGLKGDKLSDNDLSWLGTTLGASGSFDDNKKSNED